MFFRERRRKRDAAKRFADFHFNIQAHLDLLMGHPFDERLIPEAFAKMPGADRIVEEEFNKDIETQMAGTLGRKDLPQGAILRQRAARTVAVRLAVGVFSGLLADEFERGAAVGGDHGRTLAAEMQKALAECPVGTGPTLTDVGGGHLSQLAGQAIRSLRSSPSVNSEAVANRSMTGQDVEWLTRRRTSDQEGIAFMLVTTLATAKRWKEYNLIDPLAARYEDLVRLVVLAGEVLPNA